MAKKKVDTLKIRITTGEGWYADRVGEEHEVVDEAGAYRLVTPPRPGWTYYVTKAHSEIVYTREEKLALLKARRIKLVKELNDVTDEIAALDETDNL